MVREGSISSNRKETRAYLIRDLQVECDCKLLEIMRVKIYMLIPKLTILGNTVSERERFHENYEPRALRAFPSGLLHGSGRPMLVVTCTSGENLQLHVGR